MLKKAKKWPKSAVLGAKKVQKSAKVQKGAKVQKIFANFIYIVFYYFSLMCLF